MLKCERSNPEISLVLCTYTVSGYKNRYNYKRRGPKNDLDTMIFDKTSSKCENLTKQ